MRVGVVGLGTMGLGIAQLFAGAGATVLATDSQSTARDAARGRIAGALAERVAAGRMAPDEREAILGRLVVVVGPRSLGPADLMIEAISEDLAAKRLLIDLLERVLAPEAVIATNTSSLSVAALAEGARRPERVLGLHFFNPAPVMRLVELVRHPGSSTAALSRARSLAESAGRTVIECPDRPGFVVNRCARPFYGEALAMLEEGRSASDIDAAMLAAGYRIGPLSLIDLVGADVNLAATRGVAAGMEGHPRFHVFRALEEQVASGALGRKAGRGFVFPDRPGPAPPDAPAIARRIEATLVNEAGWLLAEGGVTTDGIDAAMRLGLNFPRGPFEALREVGRARLAETLAGLEARAPAHLAGRYRPAPMLEA